MKKVEALPATSPRPRLKALAQIVVGVAGALYVFSGAALLFAPLWFYRTIGDFGAFNQHYEGDAGAFLLPLGLGLLVAAYQPLKYPLLVWVGAVGSLAHACNHLYADLVGQPSLTHLFKETIPLFLLAALLLWVAVRGSMKQMTSAR